jgi:UDP-N-acetyl-D-mannosaminuronate dehydrogenase
MTLQTFTEKQKEKQIVLVQGLGFVGSVMSLVAANAINGDYAVIGVDQDNETGRRTVDMLNNGTFPIIADDHKISEYFKTVCKKGNFFATVDPLAYSKADIIIVDIKP